MRLQLSSAGKLSRFSTGLLILLAPILVLYAIVYLLGAGLYRLLLTASVWVFWCPRGRNVLFVYSESPNWQPYIEETILPRISSRAVVLNWSERSRWHTSLATHVFYKIGGPNEFNPLAIVFRPTASLSPVRASLLKHR